MSAETHAPPAATGPASPTSPSPAPPPAPTRRALHALPASRRYGNPARPDMVAVGTIVWLASELMFFSAIFAMYFTIDNVTSARPAPDGTTLFGTGEHMLNPTFAFINTIVLVLSSVTCQLGVMKVHHGDSHQLDRTGKLWQLNRWGMREWYVLTFVLGSIFVAGQVYEYAELISEGLTISSDGFGSVFYIATGFHGLHVTGGLFAFLLLLGRTFLARTWTHENAVATIVVSYYWHFVDVVWIVLFAVIYGDPLSRMIAGWFGG